MNHIGNYIIEYHEVESTNIIAHEMVTSGKFKHGTVVWAHHQTNGRGQGNNTWQSKPGKNLTFSILLKPGFLPAGNQFLLTKSISLGICDYLSAWIPGFQIKWPNDLCFQTRKIGGVLMTHMVSGSYLAASVIGIGLNINQTDFDPHLPNPVSLIGILNRELVLQEELKSLCNRLNARYNQLMAKEWRKLDQDYCAVLRGFHQWSEFFTKGQLFEGMIEGVDNFGRLLVKTRSGEVNAFNHREVEYL